MKSKLFDLIVVVVLPIIATIATFIFTANLFVAILLYFGLPALYLSVRNTAIISKSVLFAAIFFIPLSLFFDTTLAVNGAYIISDTVFPFRILGISAIELYLYAFFWLLFPVLFYEHFFDNGKSGDSLSSHVRYLMYAMVALASSVTVIFFFHRAWLYVPYAYFILASVSICVPLLLFLWNYPQFIGRYILISAYFFGVMFVFELAALHNHQWIFPGQYVGLVRFFGYAFPFEEFLFWMIFGTPALLVYYEYFADNRKL
ncbi:hypothetical protein HYV30_01760 [Candidatus Kaiserbacteria bacterium]|nr:hypothetical protein [Candidatus Kaiserbacteria bacterium]